ncbi:MAG: DUF6049 family protein [Actinomycetota bacterium]
MTAPTMRRFSAVLLAAFALAIALPPLPAARAQETSTVRLALLSQTPWNSTDRAQLVLHVRAENEGDQQLDDLSLEATLFGAVLSRTAYESSLLTDPSTGILSVQTFPTVNSLDPGASRVFRIEIDLSAVSELSATQSLVYPLKIDLRSGPGSLAAIRTPVVFLVRTPLVPLNLAWTFVLTSQVHLGPDGVFESPALERAISKGGRLAEEIRALSRLVAEERPPALDVVVSPMLLVQLAAMRNGYSVLDGGQVRTVGAGHGGAASAAQMFAELKEIAASSAVELSTFPYSEPSLPALAASGLAGDLQVQLERGADTAQTLLGLTPVRTLLCPPGSELDQTSLDQLPAQGIELLLLDSETVSLPQQAKGFAPPPAVSLPTDDSSIVALVSDPNVEALLSSSLASGGGALAAQAVLGELAVIWLQAPSEERAIALRFPETLPTAPGALFGPLVRGAAEAPWLVTRKATALAVSFPPTAEARPGTEEQSTFAPTYVEQLTQARRKVEILRPMLAGDSRTADQLDAQLLIAEAGQFVQDPTAGEQFIASVRGRADAALGAVRPDGDQTITLTSSSAKGIPVRITNGNKEPVRVTVRLLSQHLRTSPRASVVLPADETATVSLDVELRTTGRFPVTVQVLTPSGYLIAQGTLVVRSTALNRIALVITIGAALLALLVWARRFLPRRTS